MKLIYFVTFLCFFIVKCGSMSQSEIEDFANFIQETSHLDQNLKSKDPEADYDEDEPVDNAWEESGKFEGDLILNDRQRRMIVTNVVEGLARNGLTDSTKRWPNNEVVYFIQREHFNLDQVQAIQDGLDDLARASCIKFIPYKKGDRDAVVIQGSRRGCFSQVGYQGGYQVLNLSGRHPVGRGCFRHGTVVHELLHTLGFYHMQSSPDRDDYIDVHWENIIQAARHNFRKYNTFSVSDFGVGYDYESVLHYGQKAFSVNGQDTLVPKQLGANIGQRVGLSQKDVQKLNKMYCDADSDLQLDDSSKSPVLKKKSRKNKPFQGRGIGYHQGKTVVINLADAQTYNLNDIDKLNDFSGTKETSMPSMSVQGFGVTQEINDFPISESLLNKMKDESKDLQALLYRFSNVVNSKINPSDARKFDYEHSNEYNTPMTELMQPKPNLNHIQNSEWYREPVHRPQDDQEILALRNKENMYDHSDSGRYHTDDNEREIIGYNKNIAYHTNNQDYSPIKENRINNYSRLRTYKEDAPYNHDNLYEAPPQIYRESGKLISTKSFLNAPEYLQTIPNKSQRQTQHQFHGTYLNNR
ncbi:unnamed protein product [Pieris macdunnoughi]|uniref:Metalloendopeptidase n=2 Tax=Pieris macdunnoughi TaxID=345717 RepID=A0A821NDX0_9NEOP|nr:unnamed protein product [Pieris macdunnoughi]